jgi:DNA-directed RNA polymerase subunit H
VIFVSEEVPAPASRFNVLNHVNVPLHEVLTDSEAKEVLKRYGITKEQLPKVRSNDPVVQVLQKQAGADGLSGKIVQITRRSPTAGTAVAYRLIVEAI